jgi:cell shape-determining protein MreC
MAVVNSAGLVGRIVRADSNRSTVRLVTAPDFVVTVRMGSDSVLARGTGDPQYLDAGEGLRSDTVVKQGDVVKTSGDAMSKFPADLLVGSVTDVQRSPGGVQQRVRVQLYANVAAAEFVSVITGGRTAS